MCWIRTLRNSHAVSFIRIKNEQTNKKSVHFVFGKFSSTVHVYYSLLIRSHTNLFHFVHMVIVTTLWFYLFELFAVFPWHLFTMLFYCFFHSLSLLLLLPMAARYLTDVICRTRRSAQLTSSGCHCSKHTIYIQFH